MNDEVTIYAPDNSSALCAIPVEEHGEIIVGSSVLHAVVDRDVCIVSSVLECPLDGDTNFCVDSYLEASSCSTVSLHRPSFIYWDYWGNRCVCDHVERLFESGLVESRIIGDPIRRLQSYVDTCEYVKVEIFVPTDYVHVVVPPKIAVEACFTLEQLTSALFQPNEQFAATRSDFVDTIKGFKSTLMLRNVISSVSHRILIGLCNVTRKQFRSVLQSVLNNIFMLMLSSYRGEKFVRDGIYIDNAPSVDVNLLSFMNYPDCNLLYFGCSLFCRDIILQTHFVPDESVAGFGPVALIFDMVSDSIDDYCIQRDGECYLSSRGYDTLALKIVKWVDPTKHCRMFGPEFRGDNCGDGPTVRSKRSKDQYCHEYLKDGVCRFGDNCRFKHGAGDDRVIERKVRSDKYELCSDIGGCTHSSHFHKVKKLDGSMPSNNAEKRLMSKLPKTELCFQICQQPSVSCHEPYHKKLYIRGEESSVINSMLSDDSIAQGENVMDDEQYDIDFDVLDDSIETTQNDGLPPQGVEIVSIDVPVHIDDNDVVSNVLDGLIEVIQNDGLPPSGVESTSSGLLDHESDSIGLPSFCLIYPQPKDVFEYCRNDAISNIVEESYIPNNTEPLQDDYENNPSFCLPPPSILQASGGGGCESSYGERIAPPAPMIQTGMTISPIDLRRSSVVESALKLRAEKITALSMNVTSVTRSHINANLGARSMMSAYKLTQFASSRFQRGYTGPFVPSVPNTSSPIIDIDRWGGHNNMIITNASFGDISLILPANIFVAKAVPESRMVRARRLLTYTGLVSDVDSLGYDKCVSLSVSSKFLYFWDYNGPFSIGTSPIQRKGTTVGTTDVNLVRDAGYKSTFIGYIYCCMVLPAISSITGKTLVTSDGSTCRGALTTIKTQLYKLFPDFCKVCDQDYLSNTCMVILNEFSIAQAKERLVSVDSGGSRGLETPSLNSFLTAWG